MKKNNKTTFYTFILSFIILNTYIAFCYYSNLKTNNNYLRLHIVANSNSIDDQIVKLKVNEKITEYIDSLNMESLTNAEIMNSLNNNLKNILELSNNVLKNDNKNYTSKIEIGKIYYDSRDTQLYHMNNGTYNSIKVILGNGDGKNIWEFISPSKENLEKIRNYETIMPGLNKLIDTNYCIHYKSKIIELLNKY